MFICTLLLALSLAELSFGASGQVLQPGQPAPGQDQRTPPRDPTRPGEQPIGTAIMRGQIVSTDGTPLRRALVRAIAADGRGGGSATTDAQGRFDIKELPAGRFTVSASKAGYVTMQFGQRNAENVASGTVLDVLDGQLVERISIALPRGGVITGRILDDFGEPIAGAQVSALRYRYMSGGRRLIPSASDTSDDQGTFRIYGLPPGEYFVSGTVRGQPMTMPNMNATEEGYAPSYYPGTPNVAEAQRVTVRAGQELSGINFALTAARMARVRGRVITAAGDPPPAPMMVMAVARDSAVMAPMMMTSAQTRPDGSFQINGVAPGTYTITARPMGAPGPHSEIAQASLTVSSGEDVDNVLIVLTHGAMVRGRITTDEGTPLPLAPAAVRVMSTPATPGPDFIVAGGMPPRVNDDWTFELSGLVDRRVIRASVVEPGDWHLNGVYYRGEDVTDTPMVFAAGQTLEGFEVVFTRKANEVSGVVRDDRGQPVLDATVVIFASDPERWTFLSRYVRMARVDQEGRFRLRNMPSHEDYRLIAVRDLEDGRWSDPEFLEQASDLAARVAVGEGQTAVQDLKLQRAP